jgi:transcriptional regulator with XRE-family HTH domain
MTKNGITQDAIRLLRSSLGFSQEALARDLELSWRTVNRYEGDSPPTGPALIRLIDFAERKNCEEAATALRRAYIADMKGEGLHLIFQACVKINNSLRELVDMAKTESDPAKNVRIASVGQELTVAFSALVKVLPFNPETHELEW